MQVLRSTLWLLFVCVHECVCVWMCVTIFTCEREKFKLVRREKEWGNERLRVMLSWLFSWIKTETFWIAFMILTAASSSKLKNYKFTSGPLQFLLLTPVKCNVLIIAFSIFRCVLLIILKWLPVNFKIIFLLIDGWCKCLKYVLTAMWVIYFSESCKIYHQSASHLIARMILVWLYYPNIYLIWDIVKLYMFWKT